MARKPEDRDPNEIMPRQYHDPIILALAELGGSARKEPVIKIVGEMMKDQFHDCDWQKLYRGPNGIEVAPKGYPEEKTFPLWENKVSYSHEWLVKPKNRYAVASNGLHTLTEKGWQYVARLRENKHG